MTPPALDVAALLAWFRAGHRAMPWRAEVSPYRTLVSELMLQQTRVETVIPYFDRFLALFPTVEALAAAPEARVMEAWAGLGYYRRARNLQKIARAVVDAGGFPDTVQGLEALPGVGPYTAGAIASIALGRDAALVDGNVERVLARVFALESTGATLRKRAWREAHDAVARVVAWAPGSAGDFNQGLMELGATVCVPRNPRCEACPIAAGCAGRSAPESYPGRVERKASPTVQATAWVRVHAGRVWLARRPDGLLGGLWEPPISADWVAPATTRSVGNVVHVFSHRRLVVDVRVGRLALAAEAEALPLPALTTGAYVEEAWVPLREVEGRALSRLAEKVLAVGLLEA